MIIPGIDLSPIMTDYSVTGTSAAPKQELIRPIDAGKIVAKLSVKAQTVLNIILYGLDGEVINTTSLGNATTGAEVTVTKTITTTTTTKSFSISSSTTQTSEQSFTVMAKSTIGAQAGTGFTGEYINPLKIAKSIKPGLDTTMESKTITPPSPWPEDRTHQEDFSLAVKAVPYDLYLRIDGVGEERIVSSGALAVTDPTKMLFNQLERGAISIKAAFTCQVGGKATLTPQQTLDMFEITWPAGSVDAGEGYRKITVGDGDLDLSLGIKEKYLDTE